MFVLSGSINLFHQCVFSSERLRNAKRWWRTKLRTSQRISQSIWAESTQLADVTHVRCSIHGEEEKSLLGETELRHQRVSALQMSHISNGLVSQRSWPWFWGHRAFGPSWSFYLIALKKRKRKKSSCSTEEKKNVDVRRYNLIFLLQEKHWLFKGVKMQIRFAFRLGLGVRFRVRVRV